MAVRSAAVALVILLLSPLAPALGVLGRDFQESSRSPAPVTGVLDVQAQRSLARGPRALEAALPTWIADDNSSQWLYLGTDPPDPYIVAHVPIAGGVCTGEITNTPGAYYALTWVEVVDDSAGTYVVNETSDVWDNGSWRMEISATSNPGTCPLGSFQGAGSYRAVTIGARRQETLQQSNLNLFSATFGYLRDIDFLGTATFNLSDWADDGLEILPSQGALSRWPTSWDTQPFGNSSFWPTTETTLTTFNRSVFVGGAFFNSSDEFVSETRTYDLTTTVVDIAPVTSFGVEYDPTFIMEVDGDIQLSRTIWVGANQSSNVSVVDVNLRPLQFAPCANSTIYRLDGGRLKQGPCLPFANTGPALVPLGPGALPSEVEVFEGVSSTLGNGFNLTAIDPDVATVGQVLNFTAAAIPDYPDFEQGLDAQGAIRWTPTQQSVRDYTILYHVRDDAEDPAEAVWTFILHVRNRNDAPQLLDPGFTLGLGPQLEGNDTTVALGLTDLFGDADLELTDAGQPADPEEVLLFNVTATAPLEATLAPNGSLTLSVPDLSVPAAHDAIVQLRATDHSGANATLSLIVRLAHRNHDPALNGTVVVNIPEDGTLDLDVRPAVLDADLDTEGYLANDSLIFRLRGFNASVMQATLRASTLSLAPVADWWGSTSVVVQATDQSGRKVDVPVGVNVLSDNDAPRITSQTPTAIDVDAAENVGGIPGAQGTVLQFDLQIVDADEDPLQVLWEVHDAQDRILRDRTGSSTRFSLALAPVGAYSANAQGSNISHLRIVARITDGHGGTATTHWNVTIHDVDVPPQLLGLRASSTELQISRVVNNASGISVTEGQRWHLEARGQVIDPDEGINLQVNDDRIDRFGLTWTLRRQDGTTGPLLPRGDDRPWNRTFVAGSDIPVGTHVLLVTLQDPAGVNASIEVPLTITARTDGGTPGGPVQLGAVLLPLALLGILAVVAVAGWMLWRRRKERPDGEELAFATEHPQRAAARKAAKAQLQRTPRTDDGSDVAPEAAGGALRWDAGAVAASKAQWGTTDPDGAAVDVDDEGILWEELPQIAPQLAYLGTQAPPPSRGRGGPMREQKDRTGYYAGIARAHDRLRGGDQSVELSAETEATHAAIARGEMLDHVEVTCPRCGARTSVTPKGGVSILHCTACGLQGRFKTATLSRTTGTGAEESADETEIGVRKGSRKTVGPKTASSKGAPAGAAAVQEVEEPLPDLPQRTGRSAAGELDDVSEDQWQRLPKKAVNCPKCATRILLGIEAGATAVPVVCPSCGAKGTYRVR